MYVYEYESIYICFNYLLDSYGIELGEAMYNKIIKHFFSSYTLGINPVEINRGCFFKHTIHMHNYP